MDNVDLAVLRKLVVWRAQGRRILMGTIVRTWGSAPRPIGSIVAICDDGQIAGSVSGGCIEDDLIGKIREGSLVLAHPCRVKYGVSAEEANRYGLPCGGTLELLLEPITEDSRIEALLEQLATGRRMRRDLDFTTGKVRLDPVSRAEELFVDETKLVTFHGPRWRLLIIGAGQMTHYVASMAQAMYYEVIVCDPREEYADGWELPETHFLRDMPDDAVLQLKPDAHMAVIALTHDPKLDDLALIEALKSKAFYVGAIGSRKSQEKRRARLLEFDLSTSQLDKLYGPVGLKNGARTPPEIAVSILAQLTAVRYGYYIPDPILSSAMVPEQRGPR